MSGDPRPAGRGSTAPAARGIDPRGPRFAAALTAVVLSVALVTGSPWVLALQVVVFATATVRGVTASPYGWVYRRFVRPRLGPPVELENPAPPRFAQGVGLVVTGLGLLLALASVPAAVPVSAAVALVAALLNAVFGICLGCLIYLQLVRVRVRTL